MKAAPGAALVSLILGCAEAQAEKPSSFVQEVERWRAERLERLRGESGWLSLVGLFWLNEGENRLGSSEACTLRLPPELAPPEVGRFFLEAGKVRVVAHAGVKMTLRGAPVTEQRELKDDSGETDQLLVGDLMLYVVRRGARVGIRAKSPRSPARLGFQGLEYYPPSEKYRVLADFIPAATPRQLGVPTILGTVDKMTVPGTLRFTLDGRSLTLEPVLEEPGATELFLIFKDATAGKETYPAGRFLYAPLPKDGKVLLDFNRAYNPPCAFTDFATCPLPPKENVLPVRIEAGEKRYRGGH